MRYLALAHNQRVGATTKANVLLNLGREDRLDSDGLRRLVRSINRYLGEPDLGAGTDAILVTGTEAGADGLRLIASRPAGAAWLLDGLWKALDVDVALRKVLGGRRFTTDVERVLFALVANRAIDPASKLAAAEWASCDVAIPGLDAMDEDQAYRAMDLLIEADTDASVQEAVFFAVADLLNLEVDLLFFDTTSTYFERDTEDPDPSDPDPSDPDPSDPDATPGFRRYGHSKDHRKDLPPYTSSTPIVRTHLPDGYKDRHFDPYLAAIQYEDAQIARLIAHLESRGVLKNTDRRSWRSWRVTRRSRRGRAWHLPLSGSASRTVHDARAGGACQPRDVGCTTCRRDPHGAGAVWHYRARY